MKNFGMFFLLDKVSKIQFVKKNKKIIKNHFFIVISPL